jgi:hypothetical protein
MDEKTHQPPSFIGPSWNERCSTNRGLGRINPKLIEEIQNQALDQWVDESQALAKIIYEDSPYNSRLGKDYYSRYFRLLKMQLQRGGLRLASKLNDNFK